MKVFLTLFLALAGVLVSAAPKVFKSGYHNNQYAKPRRTNPLEPKPRIDGGQEATLHSIPYQVFLEVYTTGIGWFCGGVLISANYVLTTAHCIDSTIIAYVVLGAHNLKQQKDTAVLMVSEEMIMHENFSIYNSKLPESVEFTDAIQPVKLPKRSDVDNAFVDAVGIASGWGSIDYESSISTILNYVEVQVITNRYCRLIYGGLVANSILCTSGLNHVSTCLGDSGGPLVVDEILIGITSYFAYGCGDDEAPSGYTRISSFVDWIEENSDVIIV